jgi:hemerythrin superfamily protein
MKNLIIAFESIGEASMYIVDNKTYDTLFSLYEAQKRGPNGYSEMMEEFQKILNEKEDKGSSYVKSVYLQWNSHNHLKKPVTFRRILQVLQE